MKILQLANKLPYPPRDGGSIATLSLSKSFARLGHDVTVLAMNTSKHHFDIDRIPENIQQEVDIRAVEVNTDIHIFHALKNFLFSRLPFNAERFITHGFENELINILRRDNYDIIQLEGLYLAPYIDVIRSHSQAKVAMRAHNVEHEIWQRTVKQSRGPKSMYFRILSNRIRQMEISYLNAYDMLVPITGRDADIFKGMGCHLPVHVAPTGIFPGEYVAEREKIDFPSVFHIGALDWTPNQEGLFWFLDHVWNGISRKYPGLRFYIAGRNAPERISKIRRPNVVFLGEVEDAREFMNTKAIMVIPLLSGSGMRIKIIEGMALGKTIISTSIGAEGIECEHGENILIADNPEDFTLGLEQLLNNFDNFEMTGKKAMQFVRERYDNIEITASLVDFYNENL